MKLLSKISNIFSNTKSYNQLVKICTEEMHLATLYECLLDLKKENSDLYSVEEYSKWYPKLINNYVLPAILNISRAKAEYEQMIKIRIEILNCADKYLSAMPFFENKLSINDKEIIADAILDEKNNKNIVQLMADKYNFYMPACIVLRYLSSNWNDFNENDYLPFYIDTYTAYINNYYQSIIAKHNENENCFSLIFTRTYESVVNEAKIKILTGENYYYNKKEIENEAKEKERRKLERQPKKQKSIFKHQVDELSIYLAQRLKRAKAGDIFEPIDNKAIDFANIFIVDTALMLIALYECLISDEIAVLAIKKIICNLSGDDEELIDIGAQMILFNRYKEVEDQGWLAHVCLCAVCFIYRIDISVLSKNEQYEFGTLSAKYINTIFEVFQKTKEVFGWTSEEED